MSHGPTARRAINPDAFLAYITAKESYIEDGTPKRKRLCINRIPVSDSDARMIRRWRQGNIQAISIPSGAALLRRYSLTPLTFTRWCAILHMDPMLRGDFRADD